MTTSVRTLAIAVALAAVAVGAMQTIGPSALGLPPEAAGWLGVLSAVAAAAQAFLPAVHHRVRRLPPASATPVRGRLRVTRTTRLEPPVLADD